jgi:hypothetical protein
VVQPRSTSSEDKSAAAVLKAKVPTGGAGAGQVRLISLTLWAVCWFRCPTNV